MKKWYEQTDGERPAVVSSRVRLVRNWNRYVFPERMTETDSLDMIRQLKLGLRGLTQLDHRDYEYIDLQRLGDLDKKVLQERRIINETIAARKKPSGVILSEDECVEIVLNGTDHIRIQLLSAGLHLEELWKQADRIDDYINEQIEYAFDEKYGYLTSFPTNMGTGLRASVVLHLPSLSMGKKFNGLAAEMSRFGVSVKSVYGEGNENYGALYEVSNQKTLGISEKEILDLVARAAIQLSTQERQVRKMAMEKHGLECADEAYKSYGVLKYARRLSYKDAMTFLSQLMTGIADGILETKDSCNVYRLMLGIQPANLQKLSDRPLGKEELDMARASYLRRELPELR